MKVKPKAMVLTGYGINCDYETATACEIAGFESKRIHLNDAIASSRELFDYKLIVFPGGFSFGDDLGSGVAFSAKVRFSLARDGGRLYDYIVDYVERGGIMLGICNGFQILVRLGVIPAIGGRYGEQQVTLAPNREGYYIDRWVNLRVEGSSRCVFTAGMSTLRLPVRHGEGRLLAENLDVIINMEHHGQVCLRYCDENFDPTDQFPENPNGSMGAIAGLCDPSGRIFGLMPHPEASVSLYQYPHWTRLKEEARRNKTSLDERGYGYLIFKNAYDYVK
ncbi:MAG: phosphoribosylformylglycinamidine synthase subunit PurQ [Spirochaetota bacterium]